MENGLNGRLGALVDCFFFSLSPAVSRCLPVPHACPVRFEMHPRGTLTPQI